MNTVPWVLRIQGAIAEMGKSFEHLPGHIDHKEYVRAAQLVGQIQGAAAPIFAYCQWLQREIESLAMEASQPAGPAKGGSDGE
jgi:hypothetical protein